VRVCIIAALLLVGCTPAIIGVSVALGAATATVTYEVTDDDPAPCDGGAR
jgi:hypothetical protein